MLTYTDKETGCIYNVDDWWKHAGAFDRSQVTGIPYADDDTAEYLGFTDDWWENLSDEEKLEAYEDFFYNEC